MDELKIHKVGIIMNGVTGRMGTHQHLMRSIVAIIKQGGVRLSDSETIMPDPILVGRNPVKLQHLVEISGIEKCTTSAEDALKDSHNVIYFDAQTTDRRVDAVKKAIRAGKHVYCEKPTATTAQEAYQLYTLAKKAGVKNGVVQDKLWLPGLLKLRSLIDSGFFGEILSVQGQFGYWVFEGHLAPPQRPSWNYRKEEGGGMIIDMFCHWRYVIDNLFGDVKGVSAVGATQVAKRWDERNKPFACTADDAAYAVFELENGMLVQFNSSWATRVRRDDLLTLQVDGTRGSAVAGLRRCWIQPYAATPRAVWNPDVDNPHDFRSDWQELPDQQAYDNAFKVQWELFLRHVVKNEPFRWNLLEGAKGVQLAEKGIESWRKRAWVNLPKLKV